MGEARPNPIIALVLLLAAAVVSVQSLFVYGFLFHLPPSLRYFVDILSLAKVSADLLCSIAISVLASTVTYHAIYALLSAVASLIGARSGFGRSARIGLRKTLRKLRRFGLFIRIFVFIIALQFAFLGVSSPAPLWMTFAAIFFFAFGLILRRNTRISHPIASDNLHGFFWPVDYATFRRASMTLSVALLTVALASAFLGAMKFESLATGRVRIYLADRQIDRTLVIPVDRGVIVMCERIECEDDGVSAYRFINYDAIEGISPL